MQYELSLSLAASLDALLQLYCRITGMWAVLLFGSFDVFFFVSLLCLERRTLLGALCFTAIV